MATLLAMSCGMALIPGSPGDYRTYAKYQEATCFHLYINAYAMWYAECALALGICSLQAAYVMRWLEMEGCNVESSKNKFSKKVHFGMR